MFDRGIEGDVAARMDAYRGNPQALQQKYAQNQQLIDLLALQKLKSEKEAAARQMQMQMAQQQAAQGQQPTIKDQREQEVMGMTKQEIAQQVGGIAQQQQQDQQKKMQQLLQSGIASAPAPNMARMAGGGIVAFAGEDGSYVQDIIEKETREIEQGLRKDYSPEAKQAMEQQSAQGRAKQDAYLRREQQQQLDRSREIARTAGAFPSPAAPRPAPAAPVPGAPTTSTPGDLRRLEAQAGDPYVTGPAATPPVQPQTGIASVVPGTMAAKPPAPAAPTAPTAAAPAMTDPVAMRQAEESRVAGLLGLTPEQRKVYDENIAGLKGLYKEEMDPEARRERQLSAFLRGAGGRSSLGSVMAGASGAAEAERQRGYRESVKGTEAIQKKLEDVIGIQRGAVKEGVAAGQEAGKLGGQMRGQDIQSRDKELDRQVEKQKVAVQREANEALRDQNNFQRLQGTLQNVNRAIAQIEQNYAKSPQYGGQLSMLQMQLQAAKGDDAKKIRTEIDTINKELDAVVARAVGDLVRQRDALEAAMGGKGSTSGFKVEKIK